MVNFISRNNIIIFLFIFIIAFILRLIYFNQLDSWFDEWNMLYTVDPNVSNEITWKRYFGDRGDGFLPEYYPPLNAFTLKYFLSLFGYTTESARIYSLIFGLSSCVAFYYLSNFFSKNNNDYLSNYVFALNLFLIWQSSEIRPHSFVLFFAILNLILFINLIKNNKSIILIILYLISSLILLSSWPFTLTIYIGKTAYLLVHYKKLNLPIIKIFIIFSLIILIYIFFNYEYLIYHLKRDSHYTNLEISFFYSFHFRSFFGSIFLGAIFLILFSFYLIKDFKENTLSKNDINILLYIIITTYFLVISYSILRAGVISPKYVIFILPLIIIWVCNKIELSKYKKTISIIIFLSTTLNLILFFFDNPIKRPPFKDLIHLISNSDTKTIFTNNSIVFNNSLKTYKKFSENDLIILNDEELDLHKKFWFVCLNNPSFAVGDKVLPIEEKCKKFHDNNNYKVTDNIDLRDFLIRKYEINE